MTSSNSTTLLMDAPAGRHFAQLHKDPHVLADAVGIFVETGLVRGEAVLVVAPLARIPAYRGSRSELPSWCQPWHR